jgi:GNAT superfamily N-acetyltransferase
MKVVSYRRAAEFWQVAGPLLTADPVHNTMALSVANRLLMGAVPPEIEPILLTVHDHQDVIGAAVCTPPNGMAVSAIPPGAAAAVVDQLRADKIQLPGANGSRATVEAFAAAWTADTGDELAILMEQCLYRLDTLTPPTDVPGAPHDCTDDDVDLLADWRLEFAAEALAHHTSRTTLAEAARQVRVSLAMGNGQILWRLGAEPVALACAGRPTAGMSRIGPVYTPPGRRGHGYGSAATAAAATWALTHGAEHVLLFTDLTNQVSNSIYRHIGFQPVEDALDVAFRPIQLP